MIGSNHFNLSQERLQCDYVTNILQKEMIIGIPHQVYIYNSLSMFPQSHRHYPTYPIRAVVTSIIHREVLFYLIIYQFIYSVINGVNVLLLDKKKDHPPIYISWSYFIYTIYNNHNILSSEQMHSIIPLSTNHHVNAY